MQWNAYTSNVLGRNLPDFEDTMNNEALGMLGFCEHSELTSVPLFLRLTFWKLGSRWMSQNLQATNPLPLAHMILCVADATGPGMWQCPITYSSHHSERWTCSTSLGLSFLIEHFLFVLHSHSCNQLFSLDRQWEHWKHCLSVFHVAHQLQKANPTLPTTGNSGKLFLFQKKRSKNTL